MFHVAVAEALSAPAEVAFTKRVSLCHTVQLSILTRIYNHRLWCLLYNCSICTEQWHVLLFKLCNRLIHNELRDNKLHII